MTALEKRFKKKMIDKDLHLKDVANEFGWTTQYVNQLLKGATWGPAADKNLQKIKDYVGLK